MEGTDVAVVALVRQGQHDAFRILVERHSRAVFRVAYRLTGHEQDAEDVVQETFLRAYRQLSQFEARASFSTWLYRIAFNCAHDLLRQRPKAGTRISLDDDGTGRVIDVHDGSPDANPEVTLASRQLGDRLRAAMAALTPQERAAFELRHQEGMSIDEIGTVLELGTSAAKHSIFRAVRKLRAALRPLDETTGAFGTGYGQ